MKHCLGPMRAHSVCSSRYLGLTTILFLALAPWTEVHSWSYHYSNATMDWNAARDWCRRYFTDMVAIQNQEEIVHLMNILPFMKTYYWIGIRKIDNVWTWVGTNKKLTAEAENWAAGEPNNGGNNEDCVEIYIKRQADQGKWNDESCLKLKAALCYTASCQADSCSGNGECVETINSHKCQCFEGFSGDKCETVAQCKVVEQPSHGYALCSHHFGNFTYGSTCEFHCEEGYRLHGSATTNCTSTELWSAPPPSCKVMQCEALVEPPHGSVSCQHPLGDFSFRSECEFGCEEGYQLTSSGRVQCGAQGQWSDRQPQCEAVQCHPLDAPQGISMTCSDSDARFSFGSTCSFSCADGFLLQGVASLTCTASAQWSGGMPQCEVMQCEALVEPPHGSVSCQHPLGDFSFRSECEFGCEEGYQLTSSGRVQCGAQGQWSDNQPKCEAMQCPPIAFPEGVTVSCSADELSYGSWCNFSCSRDFILHGPDSTMCGPSGNWTDEAPSCLAAQKLSLTPISIGLTVGGSAGLAALTVAAWLLKRLRQGKKFKLSSSTDNDDDEPPQRYKNSRDSLI
ncbi:L-selectin-like isoform X6 [Brienomyrus brachyistius]|uniref:L-selectin-like isoform X2 n=1 Tax=Brienomyrus brachyistius TaxID=42636 RepID=UPI0020B3364E|nr:L-selectin-like isoform X2 [Brienomyrus brachyistius]XP_048845944.1 L-selectin-like isoform X3 [Brienomyrus brachyistius]XP_048845945.1 L-selectin-like isoform X4 [Brienomyrus brachyistius]XP_048845947.1 L-selectin-like isoform X6 [Brienomyrus brachyistius]